MVIKLDSYDLCSNAFRRLLSEKSAIVVQGIGRYGMAFGWLWLINSVLAAGAFGMVWYQPWSNGSGIPETKCVLNGVSIPQVCIQNLAKSRSGREP